jgi:hypothetical protein
LTSLLSRIPSHVLTAVEDGMKAGFTQFATASSKSGLEPVQAMWSEFEPLTKKRRFDLYCSMFGPQVESLGAPKASSTRANVVDAKTDDDVQRLVEAAHELLAQAERIQNERAGVVASAVVEQDDEVEPNNFTANVVKARKLPMTIGRTFTWKGKRGDSKWEVVEVWDDGSIDAVRL